MISDILNKACEDVTQEANKHPEIYADLDMTQSLIICLNIVKGYFIPIEQEGKEQAK